jgi:outer membrane protein TolC
MKSLYVSFFVFFWSLCGAAASMAAETLTWEACVREATDNHPDLISGKETVAQAEADKDVAASAMLPQVNSEVSRRRSKTSTQTETDTYAYRVTGSQLLFDGFKTGSDVGAAAELIAAQTYNYAVISSNIRFRLRNAFAFLLRAQELIALTEEIAGRRKQNVDLVELRYEAGREHRGALLTARADLAEAQFEVAQAKRNLSVAQRELSKELGRKELRPIRAEGTFRVSELFEEKPDFESLADKTPLLKELIARKEAARLGLKSAKVDFFPEVYVSGSFGETASDWPPRDDEWSTGLTVSIPLFEGGARIARMFKAKSQLNQLQADERSGRDGVILTLEETWQALQDALDNVSVQGKFLEAARERARIASAQYSAGLVSFDDWIIIENNLVAAKKAYLNARASLLTAEAAWILAKGGTLAYGQK